MLETLKGVLATSADPDQMPHNVASDLGLHYFGGWSGGAKVLCKLSVPGRPTNLDYSRTRACCACSGCRWGMFGHFFSHLSCLFSFSLSGRWPDVD